MSFPKTLPTSRIRPVMEAPPLRWGILGSGWIADKFVESVKAHTRQDIAAVGSRSRASALAFAARWDISGVYGSYEALVAADDIDVIYVASPHNVHCTHALLAIKAGKHVLVEKPMALSLAQAQTMVSAAQRKGVFFAEALWTYFLPKFDVLQQVLDAGMIGDVRSVYTDYGEYLPRNHRIFDASLAGGPLLDLGTYPVSLLAKLLGVPAKVIGLGQNDPSGVNGQVSVVLANASGALGTMSTTLYGFTSTNAAIVGTNGSIRFDSEFHLPGAFEVWSQDGSVRLRYDEPRGGHFEGIFYEAAEVAWAVSEGRIETSCRKQKDSLATMLTLDVIRSAVNISFENAGLFE